MSSLLILDDNHRSAGLKDKDISFGRSYLASGIGIRAQNGGEYQVLTNIAGQPKVNLRFVGRIQDTSGRKWFR